MEERTFKLNEIVKIFDVKQHFVINLVQTGIIKPLKNARGRGKSRHYSYVNLIEIGVFIHLNQLNLSYAMATRILNSLHDIWEVDPKTISYICVLGFLNGELYPLARTNLFPDKISPEEAVKFLIKSAMEEKKGVNQADFSYYFIIDVKNIVNYINKRISAL